MSAALRIALLSCICVNAFAQTIRVPAGKPIMADGKIAAGEWNDATHLDFGSARLYCKRNGEFVYLAIQLLHASTGAVDLYLAPGDGSLHDLHASAKLGERVLTNGSWPESWTWWNNRGWVANVSRVESFDTRTFLPEPVREYQLERSHFPGKRWRIMLDIMTPADPEWRRTRVPARASDTSPAEWIELQL